MGPKGTPIQISKVPRLPKQNPKTQNPKVQTPKPKTQTKYQNPKLILPTPLQYDPKLILPTPLRYNPELVSPLCAITPNLFHLTVIPKHPILTAEVPKLASLLNDNTKQKTPTSPVYRTFGQIRKIEMKGYRGL